MAPISRREFCFRKEVRCQVKPDVASRVPLSMNNLASAEYLPSSFFVDFVRVVDSANREDQTAIKRLS